MRLARKYHDANLMLHYAYKRHFNDEGKGEASKIVG
jgi:hypothetical protein